MVKNGRPGWPVVAGVVAGVVVIVLSAALITSGQNYLPPLSSIQTIKKEAQPTPVYGHVHIDKTSGTTLNGRMAARFDNVCGHKGYSLDFAQAQIVAQKHIHNGTWHQYERTGDIVDKAYPKFSRTRVHARVMDEIGMSCSFSPSSHSPVSLSSLTRCPGYENCDWISFERNWKAWYQTFHEFPFPVELHVPCRDPLEHLMSRCNHMNYSLNCTADEPTLRRQVRKCTIDPGGGNRFDHQLTEQFATRCFDALAIDEYVEFMATKMRPRRWQVDLVHRTTNKPRNKTGECIWDDANAEVRDKVLQIVTEIDDSVGFCNMCIGSENDLLRGMKGG